MKSWWRAMLGYPPTWFAAIVLALVGWGVITVLEPPRVLLVVLIGLLAAAALGWPATMAATGTLDKLQFEVPRVVEVDPAELAGLERELTRLSDRQPVEQLAALQQKHQSLVNILERRLDAGELTYSRYRATAQQVFNSALHNLHEIGVAYESISTIDETYIDRRLAEIAEQELDRANAPDDEATARERASLEQRRDLRAAQRRRIAQLLAQNESALTALNRTAIALADVPIGKRPEDADAAMSALEELAERAAKYAT